MCTLPAQFAKRYAQSNTLLHGTGFSVTAIGTTGGLNA